MDRCSSRFFLALIAALLLALAGCAGKSSNTGSNSAVESVTLSPNSNNISLDLGSTAQSFSATARNGIGQVIPVTPRFLSSNNASLTIANSGQACAGTWDSLSNPAVCTPGVVGVVQVTAAVGGISSAPSTVYVHQHIDNIVVAPTTPPLADCFSPGDTNPQVRTAIFQATAFSNGVDITNSVGPMSFSSTAVNVLTINNNNKLPNNEVQVTARTPGITNLIAGISGVESSPFPFTTCLVNRVMLQIENGTGNTINFTNGGSQTLKATVFDTLGNNVSNPPLTWGTTVPLIARLGSATSTNGTNTVTARANLGASDVFAACEPPSCNIGVIPALPIYSTGGTIPPPVNQTAFGALAVNVTNSKVPTYTAWATTKDCDGALNCNSIMFSLTTSNTPIGAAVSLPFTPNSLEITPDGGQAFLGSAKGLMIVNGLGGNPVVSTASQQTTPCSVALCGQVLAISPDGKRVVVGDTVSDPNQVYIFSSGSSPVDLIIPGATAATFSPDGLKLFILTNTGTMYIYSTLDALKPVAVSGSPTEVEFSADGSIAYVAGTGVSSTQLSGFATCDQQDIKDLPGLAGTPLRIFPLSDVQEDPGSATIVQQLLAVEPPNIQFLKASFMANGLGDGQFTCNPPGLSLVIPPNSTFNLGQGNFTPLFMGLGGGGSKVIVVAQNVPAVLVFDVASGTTTPIPLVNNPSPLAAAASPDGTQIFVASCDAVHPQSQFTCGSVHVVNLLTGGDIEQAVFPDLNTHDSLCIGLGINDPPCLPNLIAVRPQ